MLQFFEENHLYTWNGTPVISVTQLFSLVGTRESKESGFRSISGVEFIRDDTAAIFGREFHAFAEIYLKGGHAEYDDNLEPYIKSFYNFLAKHPYILGDSHKLVECYLYSQKYGYAGTLDLLSFIEDTNGYLTLIDWKTSAAIAPHYKLQLAAYVQLIKENFKDINISRGIRTMTVLLKPNGDPRVEIRSPLQVKTDFNIFLSILNVFNLKQTYKGDAL